MKRKGLYVEGVTNEYGLEGAVAMIRVVSLLCIMVPTSIYGWMECKNTMALLGNGFYQVCLINTWYIYIHLDLYNIDLYSCGTKG